MTVKQNNGEDKNSVARSRLTRRQFIKTTAAGAAAIYP